MPTKRLRDSAHPNATTPNTTAGIDFIKFKELLFFRLKMEELKISFHFLFV